MNFLLLQFLVTLSVFFRHLKGSPEVEDSVFLKNSHDSFGDNCTISHEHARYKRQLPLMFPEGGTMKLLLGFAVPIENPPKLNLIFALNFQYQYAVPPNITFFTQYYPFVEVGRKRRSQEFGDRSIFYTALEKTMDGIGMDGHSCLLRTICEAAEAPVHHEGLVGSILQLILTPPYSEDQPSRLSEDVYTAARRAGDQFYDCRQLYPSCPMGHGLFDIISQFE